MTSLYCNAASKTKKKQHPTSQYYDIYNDRWCKASHIEALPSPFWKWKANFGKRVLSNPHSTSATCVCVCIQPPWHAQMKSDSNIAAPQMWCRCWGYLLEAGLHQVLREEVSDQVEESVQAADLLVLRGWVLTASPQFRVPRVNPQHEDDPEDGSDYSGGHVVHHGSATHPATRAGI